MKWFVSVNLRIGASIFRSGTSTSKKLRIQVMTIFGKFLHAFAKFSNRYYPKQHSNLWVRVLLWEVSVWRRVAYPFCKFSLREDLQKAGSEKIGNWSPQSRKPSVYKTMFIAGNKCTATVTLLFFRTLLIIILSCF